MSMLVKWKIGEHELKQLVSKRHPAVPQGPPPKGVASMRVLPDVHEALRQHDPTSKAPSFTASHFQRKPLQQQAKAFQQCFIRGDEPPRIGSRRPASTTSKAAVYVGSPTSRHIPPTDIYSNHSSTSTSSTYLCREQVLQAQRSSTIFSANSRDVTINVTKCSGPDLHGQFQ